MRLEQRVGEDLLVASAAVVLRAHGRAHADAVQRAGPEARRRGADTYSETYSFLRAVVSKFAVLRRLCTSHRPRSSRAARRRGVIAALRRVCVVCEEYRAAVRTRPSTERGSEGAGGRTLAALVETGLHLRKLFSLKLVPARLRLLQARSRRLQPRNLLRDGEAPACERLLLPREVLAELALPRLGELPLPPARLLHPPLLLLRLALRLTRGRGAAAVRALLPRLEPLPRCLALALVLPPALRVHRFTSRLSCRTRAQATLGLDCERVQPCLGLGLAPALPLRALDLRLLVDEDNLAHFQILQPRFASHLPHRRLVQRLRARMPRLNRLGPLAQAFALSLRDGRCDLAPLRQPTELRALQLSPPVLSRGLARELRSLELCSRLPRPLDATERDGEVAAAHNVRPRLARLRLRLPPLLPFLLLISVFCILPLVVVEGVRRVGCVDRIVLRRLKNAVGLRDCVDLIVRLHRGIRPRDCLCARICLCVHACLRAGAGGSGRGVLPLYGLRTRLCGRACG
mmetsp:Transcript_25994/g.60104  ORF Transcript_25994/g.60104 Transcript_25994/m.60104 type:complete len:516 (-) Transcript_25994:428-1975(-)